MNFKSIQNNHIIVPVPVPCAMWPAFPLSRLCYDFSGEGLATKISDFVTFPILRYFLEIFWQCNFNDFQVTVILTIGESPGHADIRSLLGFCKFFKRFKGYKKFYIWLLSVYKTVRRLFVKKFKQFHMKGCKKNSN